MHRITLLAAVAALVAAPAARAEIICVNNDAQLAAAFASAATPGATEIRIRTGLYTPIAPSSTQPALVYTGQSDLDISGGWTGPNNTCTARVGDPDATILSAASTGPLMEFYAFQSSGVVISLRGVSLRGGFTPSTVKAACLQIESDVGSGAEFLIEQNTFRNCTRTATSGSPGGAIALVLRSATARLRSNLVTGSFAGTGAVTLTGLGASTFYASNNTIAENLPPAGRSGPFGIQLSSAASANSFWLQNNVLWGNGGADLYVNSTVGVVLGRNIIGTRSPLPAGTIEVANFYSVDPGFIGGGNFRARSDSPMRNSGSTVAGDLATTDVMGLPRWMATSVDRGAYEFDELFAGGFEVEP